MRSGGGVPRRALRASLPPRWGGTANCVCVYGGRGVAASASASASASATHTNTQRAVVGRQRAALSAHNPPSAHTSCTHLRAQHEHDRHQDRDHQSCAQQVLQADAQHRAMRVCVPLASSPTSSMIAAVRVRQVLVHRPAAMAQDHRGSRARCATTAALSTRWRKDRGQQVDLCHFAEDKPSLALNLREI